MIGSKRALVSSISAAATILYCDLTQGVLPPWLSHSYSTTTGVNPPNYFDVGGNLQYVPNNQIRNSIMSGAVVGVLGSGGALPTNWYVTGGGFVTSVIGTGTDAAGRPYIDVSFVGTPSTNYGRLGFDTNTGISAVTGQSVISSCWLSIVGGNMTNVIGFYALTDEFNASHVNVREEATGPLTLTATPTQFSLATTLAGVASTNVIPNIGPNLTIGQPINFTLRVAAPLLSLVTAAQTTPNPFMPTSGSAYFGPVINDHDPSTLAALGLRSEPQRANLLTNNTAQGASLGVARTISGVTAITRTASASAVILAGTTNVAVGDLVTLSGATPSTYNGTWVVTAATPNVSFTILTATSATDSASGYAVAATSPGTLPTGFQNYSGGGVALVVKNIATLNGVPIVDIQVAGVTTATYTVYALNAQITSVTTGQQYTHQLYAALVGGSLTNVSSVRTATRASTASAEMTMSLSATLAPQPAATYTITGADTYTAPSIDFYYPSAGLPVNFTLRLALGKFEQNAFATSSILTYGTAVTVPADNWSFTGAALVQLVSGRACIAIEALAEGVVTNQGWFIVGSGSNNIVAFMNTATSDYFSGTTSGVSWLNYGPIVGGSILTAKRRIAMSWNGNSQAFSYDGASSLTATVNNPTGMTGASLGHGGASASYCWFSQITIRPPVSAHQVQRLSTAGVNLNSN